MAVPPSQISAVEGKAAQEPMHMVNGHERCEATQEGQGWGEDWCAASPAASCALEPKDRSFRGDLVTGPQKQVSWQQMSWLHVSRVTTGPPVPQGPGVPPDPVAFSSPSLTTPPGSHTQRLAVVLASGPCPFCFLCLELSCFLRLPSAW